MDRACGLGGRGAPKRRVFAARSRPATLLKDGRRCRHPRLAGEHRLRWWSTTSSRKAGVALSSTPGTPLILPREIQRYPRGDLLGILTFRWFGWNNRQQNTLFLS